MILRIQFFHICYYTIDVGKKLPVLLVSVPFLMASIIDDGVNVPGGDIRHICIVGAWMIAAAAVGLFAGLMGGKYGAYASAGFAKNLRQAMYYNIQTFSFANIDKYSTAGLVTRMTTDVTNVQNSYMMILRMGMRAPASMICAMVAAFLINGRIASIYLIAVVLLGCVLFFIIRKANKYFNIVFEKYDDLNASVQENVLSDINLEIRSGETIGIIGGTGSSKSSLVNLISRLYDAGSGSVIVGGHDVREYDMDTLRNQVAVVLQQNVLFLWKHTGQSALGR